MESHRQLIYNVIVAGLLGNEPLRLTPDTWNVDEFTTYVATVRNNSDRPVVHASAGTLGRPTSTLSGDNHQEKPFG